MITVIVQVDSSEGIQGIKEDLAVYCEKFGDIRHVDVVEKVKQMKFGDVVKPRGKV